MSSNITLDVRQRSLDPLLTYLIQSLGFFFDTQLFQKNFAIELCNKYVFIVAFYIYGFVRSL